MWDPEQPGQTAPAAEVLLRRGLEPIELAAKEGLAMINGAACLPVVSALLVGRVSLRSVVHVLGHRLLLVVVVVSVVVLVVQGHK